MGDHWGFCVVGSWETRAAAGVGRCLVIVEMVILHTGGCGRMMWRSWPNPGAVARLKWAIILIMVGNMSWIEGKMRAMTLLSIEDLWGSGMDQNWGWGGLGSMLRENRSLLKNVARSDMSLGKVQWRMKSS